jgi:hypothetical protein
MISRSTSAAAVLALAFFSCGTTNDDGFDPRTADRSCSADADCVILQAITDCSICGCGTSVRRGEAERRYEAALAECDVMVQCGIGCIDAPACFEGRCVNRGGYTDPPCPASGTPAVGTPAPLGAGPGGGATAVSASFDDALDPAWRIVDPSAFHIDRTEPIAGAGSLDIAYRQSDDAAIVFGQPEAKALRVAFTVRTRLLVTGLTLARVVAGDGSWFHVRIDACALSIGEVTRTATAAGMGFGNEAWPLPDDTPTRVVLTFDLRDRTITSVVSPLGAPVPAAKVTPMRGNPTGIRTLELGPAHGVQSTAVGHVWMDDLQID